MLNIIIFILVMGVMMVIFAFAIIGVQTFSSFKIKCPNCGRNMNYEGSDITLEDADHPYKKYNYYYKCPHCGKTKIL